MCGWRKKEENSNFGRSHFRNKVSTVHFNKFRFGLTIRPAPYIRPDEWLRSLRKLCQLRRFLKGPKVVKRMRYKLNQRAAQ